MSDDIPLFEIAWDERDVENVIDSVERGMYWAKGPYVTEFEERLADYLGVEHAIAVNSGTTALVTALEAHGIGSGDEVIVPPFTFIATANAVKLVDADPVFVDIERDTYGIDPVAVREAISPNTAAIIPVHIYGAVCRIKELRRVAEDHGIPLIEDAAAALGATAGDNLAGTIGDSAAFSFAQNKIAATGEGGAVVTDDEEIAKRAKLYRSHGRATEDYFTSSESGQYVRLGSNYRMPDVVAAMGCAQMAKIDDLIAGRRGAARRLNEGLADLDGIEPHRGREEDRHVYQLYTVTLDVSIDRNALIDGLTNRGIASKVYWDPIHLTDYYRESDGYESGAFPTAEDVASRVLSLPIHSGLTPQKTDRIIRAVQETLTT